MVKKKEVQVRDIKGSWASKKKYYDDERDSAILKLNSVDNYGITNSRWKQNTYDNYVYDLQTDLKKMDFLSVGEADGIYGNKTKQAVEEFQLSSLTSQRAINGSPTDIPNITFNDKIDGVVGNNTKAEIKVWLKNNYANPTEISYPVPLIAQKYVSSCWAASFQMVLAYNKFNWSQEEVCDNAGLPRARLISGDFTGDAIQEASTLGFAMIENPRRSLQTSDWVKLLKRKGPIIVTWSGPHAVVLRGITKDPNDPLIYVNNPGPVNVGTNQTVSMSDFDNELASHTEYVFYYFKGGSSRQVGVLDVERFF